MEDEIIIEEEIVLDPLQHAIALDNYFNGDAPLSWGVDNLNLVSGVTVTGKKKEGESKRMYLIAIAILVVIAIIVYFQFNK